MTWPLAGLSRDLHHGARRLAASPAFLVFAVISLAIGLSVTTAAYAILYSLFWKPVDVRDPDRVVMITSAWSAPRWVLAMSRPDFEDVRAAQTPFSALGASTKTGQSVVGSSTSAIAMVEMVAGDYYGVLRIRPAIGRLLQPADANAHVAVLSHRLWRTRFQADPDIVGEVVRIGGHPFEIVGVAPRGFAGLSRPPQSTGVWVPADAADVFSIGGANRADRDSARLAVIARLAPGRTVAEATAAVSTIGGGLDRSLPLPDAQTSRGPVRRTRQWATQPIAEALAPRDTRIGIVLIGLVGLVLVVACANLANLMLARGAVRQREIAVRRALGASRWRVIRELLVESAMIAAAGGALGLAITRVLLVFGTVEIPVAHGSLALEPALDWPVLVATGVAVLLSLTVFGLEPAIQLTRRSVTADLAAQSGSVVSARPRRQRWLIGGQVAVSTCFFLVAAILARIVIAGAAHDSGMALERLALTTVHASLLGWDETRTRRVLDRAVGIAQRQPGIEAVAVSSGMPFGQVLTPRVEITTPDKPFVKSGIRGRYRTAALLASTPQIFTTLQVPLVRGRAFDDRDDAGATKVAVISEQTARVLFGTTDAVGRQFLVSAGSKEPAGLLTVIGVTRDTDVYRYMERRDGSVFVPLSQRYTPNLVLLARSADRPVAAVGVLQDALRQADPVASSGMAGTATMLLAGEAIAARLAGALAVALGLVMLTLAMVGLYGVQMHVVAGRTREVGLRMALGASVRQIQHLVMRQGLRPVLQGVAIGIVFGIIARLGLKALVVARFEVFDPLAIAVVSGALFAAAFLACWLPARRAARVDPNVALRHL